jgi:copper chaperone
MERSRVTIVQKKEISLIQFNIPSMSCGHCVKAVTQAVHGVDPQARVDVNLDTQQVKVDSTAEQGRIVDALKEAGYEPV